MEYTKVQTALNHVKDAIIAKIDKVDASVISVKNSVTNLPDTLDSKFRALTTKVDSVKTDVEGVGGKVDAGVTTLDGKINETQSNLEKQIIANGMTDGKLSSLRHNYYDDAISKAKIIARAQEKSGSNDAYSGEILLDIKGSGTLEGVYQSCTEHPLANGYYFILIWIDDKPMMSKQFGSSDRTLITDFEHVFSLDSGKTMFDVCPIIHKTIQANDFYYRNINDLEKIKYSGVRPSGYNLKAETSVSLSKIKFNTSLKIEIGNVGDYLPHNTWKPEVFITYTLDE